jgi:hypothetical protein
MTDFAWRQAQEREVLRRASARRRVLGLGALPTLGDVTASYTAQIGANLQSNASAAGASYIQAQTGVDVTQGRVASGVAAAGHLATNGFDPTNPDDRQAMVATIAGGLSLIPAVGPALGAALEALYQIAQPLACPTAKFFHAVGLTQSDCDSPPCSYSGPAPTVDSLASSFAQPPAAGGPGFAQMVNGALLTNAASALACKSSVPPSVIVDGIVTIWNRTHQGPAVDIYIPPLLPMMPLIPQWGSVNNRYTGSVDPNLYYAFTPASTTYWSEDLSQAPAPPPNSAPPANIYGALYAAWPFEAFPSPARYVQVNQGALIEPTAATHVARLQVAGIVRAAQAAQAAQAAAGSSAASTAGAVVAGVGVAALLATAVVSWATGKAIDVVLTQAWKKVVG